MNEKDNINFTLDSDLVFASYCARREAYAWYNIAIKNVKEDQLNVQSYVLLILASELFLKSLLMVLGVDVIKKFKYNDGHNLYKLYKSLPDEVLKKSINSNVFFSLLAVKRKKSIHEPEVEFEKLLKSVADGFIQYRYNYEKLLLNEAIDIPVDFILNLTHILKKECDIFKYECVDECGNVKKMRQPIISFHDIDKGWIEIDNNYE